MGPGAHERRRKGKLIVINDLLRNKDRSNEKLTPIGEQFF